MKKLSKLAALVCALSLSASLFGGCASNGGSSSSSGSSSSGSSSTPSSSSESSGSESSSSDATGETPNIDAIKERGILVFGTESTYPPFQFIVMENGQSVGVGTDVDIGRKIAEKLGVDFKTSEMAFDSLAPALQAGTIDLAGSMTPSPERDEVIDFSDIYKETENCFIVRKDEVDTYKTLADFKDKTIGAQMGTVQATLLTTDLQNDVKNLILPKVSTLVQELKTGNIEAICVETPVADVYLAADDSLGKVTLDEVADTSGVAITTNEGATDLMAVVNEVLAELEASGELQQIYDNNTQLAIDQVIND